MKKMTVSQTAKPPEPMGKRRYRFPVRKAAYCAYLAVCLSVMYSQPAYAADVWTKAKEIMQDVYNQIAVSYTHL